MNLRGIITDSQVLVMRERDAARRRHAIERLGDKYILHPSNRIQPKRKSR